MILRISVEEVEQIAFELAKQLMTWDEPIPDFSTRYPNILESCLSVPFQSYSKKDLYPTTAKKAAILFYLMIKNHPFQNGNKRLAVMTLLVFLHKNKKWLTVDSQKLYNFAVQVASSLPEFNKEFIEISEKFIRSHLINI